MIVSARPARNSGWTLFRTSAGRCAPRGHKAKTVGDIAANTIASASQKRRERAQAKQTVVGPTGSELLSP